jgi:uroporphyrinogen-III synthase/AcrR family transcriptional regulator
MISTQKKENKKRLKRERIIDSAAELFSKKNYHEVMMEDVAKNISMAKGTVYNYFNSKEDLYFSIMHNRLEKLSSILKEKINFETSTIGSLRAFVITFYSFMVTNPNFFLILRKDTLNGDQQFCNKLINLENEIRNVFRDIIFKGVTEGLFREIKDDFAVDLILGSIYGIVYRAVENKYSEEKMFNEKQKLYEFVLHGLITDLNGNSNLPLINKTIVITRTVEQSRESSEIFKELGANVVTFPTLDIVPPTSWKEFDKIIKSKTKIDFIIFTSAHAVKMFLKRCLDLNIKLDYNDLKITAIGNKTSAVCSKFNIPVHIIPEQFSSEGVVEELSKYNLNGKVIFIPRSEIGREELPEGLEKLGAVIKAAPVYNISIPPEDQVAKYLKILKNSKPDLFIFTSPSTFENFLEILKINNPVKYFKNFDIAAIGPTTRAAIENHYVNVNIMPREYTLSGLVKAIVEYYKERKG